MSDIDTNWRNVNKILSLFSKKEQGLINRLRTELIQIKKQSTIDSLDHTEKSSSSIQASGNTGMAQSSATNLYGESKQELDETSSGAGGAVAGSANGAWGKGELTEEESVENEDVMNFITSMFNENKLFNAFYLREKVKKMITEGSEKVVTVSKLTGMNKLKRFLSQNIKSIKESYMDLTTDKAQRASFKAHLLKLLSELLQNLFLNNEKVPESDTIQESNNINFEIDDHEGQDGAILDLDGDGKEDKDEFETIPGMDETGKREAVQVYTKLEKQITTLFEGLSNDLDRKVFAKWLLMNLSDHMDKWESLFQDLDNGGEPGNDNEIPDQPESEIAA